MEDFWAFALWALRIWLYLVISLIMIPAMFGFSLGISETYMTILVKTLEVLLLYIFFPLQMYMLLRNTDTSHTVLHIKDMAINVFCLSSTVGHSEDTEGICR